MSNEILKTLGLKQVQERFFLSEEKKEARNIIEIYDNLANDEKIDYRIRQLAKCVSGLIFDGFIAIDEPEEFPTDQVRFVSDREKTPKAPVLQIPPDYLERLYANPVEEHCQLVGVASEMKDFWIGNYYKSEMKVSQRRTAYQAQFLLTSLKLFEDQGNPLELTEDQKNIIQKHPHGLNSLPWSIRLSSIYQSPTHKVGQSN